MKWIENQKGNSSADVRWIWNLDIPPKIKNFLWKIASNGLPKKARLAQNFIPVP